MFIKQIIIQGFKSYKDQTVIEPFSPKHNVIVGRNGSGKSNFFAAIRFVLSDKYTQLGREERQGLLHEGTGSAVMSAYVELIFDNSDERIPIGGNADVILRRTIGQKKDEYSLNRKNTTKQEVLSLLESAGFSRSNPYYIVPQGRVTAITNMKDSERLNMLKEVAGTGVYESRRAESHKILEETKQKRTKIDDLLEHIRGRLGELEEEKEELRQFQDKDRERRCLEYTIHHKEQERLEEQIARIDDERDGGMEQNDEHRDSLKEAEQQMESIESQITRLEQQMKLLSQEQAQYKEERTENSRTKAQIESDVQAMQDNQAAAQQAQAERANELRKVQKQIKQHESQLADLLPQYQAKKDENKAIQQQMHEANATIQSLYAKQGRQKQFRTKKERDDWLKKEIADVNASLATRKAISIETQEEIAQLESQVSQLEADIAELRHRIENRGDEQQNIAAEVQQAKDEAERLLDQRRELWREEAKLGTVIGNAQEEYNRAEALLGEMMDNNTSRGLAMVRRIVQEQDIEGAYGPLGELFECNPKYKTAVEVTAGASLFHYVVDTDATAEKLIKILQREKGGRVTFTPLNRIKVGAVELPKASDAVPLLSKLKYNQEYEKAMQQVFGRTIVCPNLQVAAQYARSHSVSAITPDGDRSDKKGALTGGYYNTKKSRIDGIKRLVASRDEYERVRSRRGEIENDLAKLDQKITKAKSEYQKVEQKRSQLEGGYGPLREELRRKEQDLGNRRDELERKQRALETIQDLLRDLSNQVDGYQTELQADFKKALSNQEERDLDTANTQLPDLRKQYAELGRELGELEAQKRSLEDVLNVNLRPRLDELQDADLEANPDSSGTSSVRLKDRSNDLKRIIKTLNNIDKKLKEIDNSIDTAQEQLQALEASRTEQRAEVEKFEQAIRRHQNRIEKGAERRGAFQTLLNQELSTIRNLGVLPEAAFTAQYANLSSDNATKRLHKAQEALKKYGHVNKKAFEQFAQFERQREDLEKRRRDLDNSDNSIKELIDVLDQRKDEAIERTFKQVSKEFHTIFEKLVPAGVGNLKIQRRHDRQANGGADEDSDDESGKKDVENYQGIGIVVSFNSKHDEQQRIQQLSGGQKSLCALALVFAIQASDPAPFYLFDEIDANLDAQYRTAVAQLLQESSQTGQFICTTFRPEMLHVAEKCYGVSYLNKASSIDVVSKEQALDFVEGQISGK
ncbi:Putative structural maintenance of chromosomes protein [Septoria linicola]|uniref:Structural maintenance of chromosomes protein n=1 Tax=Septoria linicola TaxID=215465 RepID=A0A9Q9EKA5_9PEZI|nr:putative structural maintenance of chromosomes protein [Septoria linicola]USW52188.1 Putative structural maintenance of chromosomes protein [Septoria linicola]